MSFRLGMPSLPSLPMDGRVHREEDFTSARLAYNRNSRPNLADAGLTLQDAASTASPSTSPALQRRRVAFPDPVAFRCDVPSVAPRSLILIILLYQIPRGGPQCPSRATAPRITWLRTIPGGTMGLLAPVAYPRHRHLHRRPESLYSGGSSRNTCGRKRLVPTAQSLL